MSRPPPPGGQMRPPDPNSGQQAKSVRGSQPQTMRPSLPAGRGQPQNPNNPKREPVVPQPGTYRPSPISVPAPRSRMEENYEEFLQYLEFKNLRQNQSKDYHVEAYDPNYPPGAEALSQETGLASRSWSDMVQTEYENPETSNSYPPVHEVDRMDLDAAEFPNLGEEGRQTGQSRPPPGDPVFNRPKQPNGPPNAGAKTGNQKKRHMSDDSRSSTNSVNLSAHERNRLINQFKNKLLNRHGYLDLNEHLDASVFLEKFPIKEGDILKFDLKQNGPGKYGPFCNILKVSEHTIYVFGPTQDHVLNYAGRRKMTAFAMTDPWCVVPYKGSVKMNLPDKDMDPDILAYPELFGRFENESPKHRNHCDCYGNDVRYHFPSQLNIMCLKAGHDFTPKDLMLDSEITYDNNITRVCKLHRMDTNKKGGQVSLYRVLVPQPFLISLKWEDRFYEPAFSNQSDLIPKIKYIYSCIKHENVETVSRMYAKQPSYWQSDCHPLIHEPLEGTELSLLSQNFYGSETLPRICLIVHPQVFESYPLASTLSDNLEMVEVQLQPVCRRDIWMEDGLLEAQEESIFYDELTIDEIREDGPKNLACPSCIPNISANEKQIMVQRYSRTEYIRHYAACHVPDVVFTGVHTPTNINQRILESYALYVMCKTAEYSRKRKDRKPKEADLRKVSHLAKAFGRYSKPTKLGGSASKPEVEETAASTGVQPTASSLNMELRATGSQAKLDENEKKKLPKGK